MGQSYGSSAQEKRERQIQFLANLGQVLAAALDFEDTIESTVQFVVPTVADGCVVRLFEAGELRVMTALHRRPERKADLLALAKGMQKEGQFPEEIRAAIRSGQPVAIQRSDKVPGAAGEPHLVDFLGPVGIESYAVVPLVSRGLVIGTMSFISDDSKSHFDEADLHFMTAIATRVALSIGKAQLYREAQQAARAREEILAVVAHDLKSPLASIGLAAEMLALLPFADHPKAQEYTGMITRLVDHMNRLVKDLLDFGKMQAGTFSVDTAEVDLGEALAPTLDGARLLAAEKEQAFEAPDFREGCRIACDEKRIEQVVSNLIGNAIKFSPKGGSIRCEVAASTEGVEISVSDDGPGIPPEQRALIFERYWQGEEARKAGHGLGLAIAKGIVEAHGGKIWLESGPAGGSRFSFFLPR